MGPQIIHISTVIFLIPSAIICLISEKKNPMDASLFRPSNFYFFQKVFRIGDWEVIRLDDRGEKLQVNLLLGVDNVEAGYYSLAKLGFVGIKKTIKVFVPKVRLNVALTQVGAGWYGRKARTNNN